MLGVGVGGSAGREVRKEAMKEPTPQKKEREENFLVDGWMEWKARRRGKNRP